MCAGQVIHGGENKSVFVGARYEPEASLVDLHAQSDLVTLPCEPLSF